MPALRTFLCSFAQQHLRLRWDLQLLGAGEYFSPQSEILSAACCHLWSYSIPLSESFHNISLLFQPVTAFFCLQRFMWWLFWQMHYLLYGTGMQTWEYSPLYAIRSYAYLWLHALPACLHAHVLQTNKVTIPNFCCFCSYFKWLQLTYSMISSSFGIPMFSSGFTLNCSQQYTVVVCKNVYLK